MLTPAETQHFSYLGQTRQIHQRQAKNVGRVDLEVDRLSVDTLVATSYPACLAFYLPLYILKVVPFPSGNVIEFRPFLLTCYTGWSMWDVDFVVAGFVVSIAWEVDKL